jgi:tetratricopeptide (TPR) repeat protein
MEDYWATTFNNLGTVFQVLGEMKKDQRFLQMSIATFNNALTVQKREKNPKDWAITKNNLGVSLQVFGELQQDPKILLESLECLQAALEETPQEKNPVGWGVILANLAATQRKLAEVSKEREIAQESVNNFGIIVAFLADVTDEKYLELAEQQQAQAQAILVKLS